MLHLIFTITSVWLYIIVYCIVLCYFLFEDFARLYALISPLWPYVTMLVSKARYVPKQEELAISHVKAAWMCPLQLVGGFRKALFCHIMLDHVET